MVLEVAEGIQSGVVADEDFNRVQATAGLHPAMSYQSFINNFVPKSSVAGYLAAMTKFAQVLDSADGLALEEQESLVEVLQRRLAEHRRAELVEAVKSARQEFKAGRCRPATPAQIVKRIFA